MAGCGRPLRELVGKVVAKSEGGVCSAKVATFDRRIRKFVESENTPVRIISLGRACPPAVCFQVL